MKTFINNVKNHKKLAAVCAAVFIITAAVTIWAFLDTYKKKSDNPNVKTGYFLNTDYPVYVSVEGDALLIELNSPANSRLMWKADADPKGHALAEYSGQEQGGKMTVRLKPGVPGYSTAVFRQSGTVGGIPYDAVVITASLITSSDTENEKSVSLSGIYQDICGAGATDTDTPFLIDGLKVILPNGGDWTMTQDTGSSPDQAHYDVMRNVDADGNTYLTVIRSVGIIKPEDSITDDNTLLSLTGNKAVFLLKSESLGITQRLKLCVNSEMKEYLCITEDANAK